MNIYGNKRADKKTKLGSKLRTVHHKAITSLNFLKRKVQECCLDDWQKEWQNLNYYYYSSNLRAHGICDYGTLPIM